jgi:putative Mg2+ transporter-C (MgtC) family protein
MMEPIPHILERLGIELSTVLSSTITRLVIAALLGGIIGLEREIHHKPAGLRTNMFICFGAAMFTILSDQLAMDHPGDHTRIAAQIIPGIGFIGAGSILHSRGSVTGLTTAATLFVVASVGMAAGGGLYLTAVFATGLILVALALLGNVERRFSLKSVLLNYEVTGENLETTIAELNRILEAEKQRMQNVHVAGAPGHYRVIFSVDCSRDEQDQLKLLLEESTVFSSVATLAATEHE